MDTATKINILVGVINLLALIWNTVQGYRNRRWDVVDRMKRAVREKQARIAFELKGLCDGPDGRFFDVRATNKGGLPAKDIVIKIDGIEDVIKADQIDPRWPLVRTRIKFDDQDLGMKEVNTPKATLTYKDDFGLRNVGTIRLVILQEKRADNNYNLAFSKQEPDEYNAYIRYKNKEYKKIYKSLY